MTTEEKARRYDELVKLYDELRSESVSYDLMRFGVINHFGYILLHQMETLMQENNMSKGQID